MPDSIYGQPLDDSRPDEQAPITTSPNSTLKKNPMDAQVDNQLDTDVSILLDEMDVTDGWTVLGDDTDNLTTSLNHVQSLASIIFDKVNGAGNTVFAGIQKTIASVDLIKFTSQDLIILDFVIPSLAQLDYVFVRLGTDSSNYNEWRIQADALTAATWETLAFAIGDPDFVGNTGNGFNQNAITYMAVGCAFSNQTNTQVGIQFDHLGVHSASHTTSIVSSEVTTSISSANINLAKVKGQPTAVSTGVADNATQRVAVAADAQGDAITQNPTLIGGEDTAGNARRFQTRTTGEQFVTPHSVSRSLPDGLSNTQEMWINRGGTNGGHFVQSNYPFMFNGATWDRFRGNATDGQLVNLGTNNDIHGTVAHDAVDANNPVKTGFRARTNVDSNIAEDDRSDATGDRQGRLWVDSSKFESAYFNSTGIIIAAPGAGMKLAIYGIVCGICLDSLVGEIASPECEGVTFNFSGGSAVAGWCWQIIDHTTNSASVASTTLLSINPVTLPMQHGHIDGTSNQDFRIALDGTATNLFGVCGTILYRIFPT